MSACTCPTGTTLKGCAPCQEKAERVLDRLAMAEARKTDYGTHIPLDDVVAMHEKRASVQATVERQIKMWEGVNRLLSDR